MNASVSEFPQNHIRGLLDFRSIQADDRALLDRVICNTKAYYANPKAFDDAWREKFMKYVALCACYVQHVSDLNPLTEGVNHV